MAKTGWTAEQVIASNTDFGPVAALADQTWDTAAEVRLDLANVSGPGVSVANGTITISEAGTYRLTGTWAGQLAVTAPGLVRLVLDGASLDAKNANTVTSAGETQLVLYLAQGSSNTVSGGRADEAGNLRAMELGGDLVVAGPGSLTVSGVHNAIRAGGGIVIASGDFTVNSGNNGIAGEDFFVVTGGSLNVSAGNDGIRATEQDDVTRGFFYLLDGQVNVTAGDECVEVYNDVMISGGTFHCVAQDEGIEGRNINISGGTIFIDAVDDSLNVTDDNFVGSDQAVQPGVALTITGGDLHLVSRGADTLDSNGVIAISGGTLVMETTGRGGESAIDANGPVAITGATILINGQANTSATTTTGQGWVATGALTSGTGSSATGAAGTVTVADGNGAVLGSASLMLPQMAMSFTSPEVVAGETYTFTTPAGVASAVATAEIAGRSSGGGRGRRP